MIKFTHRMTPAELAQITGYKPQTINRWAQQKQWKTIRLTGVKGGRAHMIEINDEVRQFILSTRKMRQTAQDGAIVSKTHEAADSCHGAVNTLERQLLDALAMMTDKERHKLSGLLLREGIAGILQRLGISEN